MERAPEHEVGDPSYGWLALVTPADARTFRVTDSRLERLLAAAGATIVSETPDVEIANPGALRGDGTVGVSWVGGVDASGEGGALFRFIRRLSRATRVWIMSTAARRAMRRCGYGQAQFLRWERGQPVRGLGLTAPTPQSLRQRFPLNGLAVAPAPPPHRPTILAAALERAASQMGGAATVKLGSSGVVVAVASRGVLRVAAGPAARLLAAQHEVLSHLAVAAKAPGLDGRVPAPLAAGEIGLATWTVESRQPGHPASVPLAPAVVDDCVDFLVALHIAGSGSSVSSALPSRKAEIVASVCEHQVGARVRLLGQSLDVALASVPRGFAHGDFWSGNILVDNGRLTGVVDWSAAGAGRLPLLDLVHLQLSCVRESSGEPFGQAVVSHLLSSSDLRADDGVALYCRKLGVDLEALPWTSLMLAYWLERLAIGILDPDTGGPVRLSEWRRDNVDAVLEHLGPERTQGSSSLATLVPALR